MQAASRATAPHAGLVASLRTRILDALRPLVQGNRRWGMLDYPRYANAGDSAIWLGALAAMRDLGLPPPAHVTDLRSYDRDLLARAIGDGVIVLSGGGNFGDLYPAHQHFREQVVQDFPDNRIIQLPQSVHFSSPEQARRTGETLRAHADLTLFVRDPQSAATLATLGGLTAHLCPDMAFCMEPPDCRPARDAPGVDAAPGSGFAGRGVDTLWLLRKDDESAATVQIGAVDWAQTDVPGARAQHWLGRRLPHSGSRAGRAVLRRLLTLTYRPVARERVRRACSMLSSARLVVTDRLHGHVLCVLLGMPHVLLDDRHGKVGRFCDQWTAGAGMLTRAASVAEAQELVAALTVSS